MFIYSNFGIIFLFVSHDFVGKIISARPLFSVSVEKGSFFNNGEGGVGKEVGWHSLFSPWFLWDP